MRCRHRFGPDQAKANRHEFLVGVFGEFAGCTQLCELLDQNGHVVLRDTLNFHPGEFSARNIFPLFEREPVYE